MTGFHVRRLALVGALLGGIGAPAMAQQLLDNWNTAACGYTDVVTFNIDSVADIERIDLWYRWGAKETSVNFSLSQDGTAVGEGDLVRADCDRYQPAWCIARVEPRAEFEPGTYVIRTARARICQNAGSQGFGFVKLFGTKR